MADNFGDRLLWEHMRRVGKRHFIWYESVVFAIPLAIVLATLAQLRESSGNFMQDLLSFGVKLVAYLVVGVPLTVAWARWYWNRCERRFRP